MVWQLLAKPLLGVAADGVKAFAANKAAKNELKLTDLDGSVKLLLHYLAEEKAKNKEQILKKIKDWC